MKETLNQAMARHTGQDIERIKKDVERDFYMTAAEASDYGLIDEVIENRAEEG